MQRIVLVLSFVVVGALIFPTSVSAQPGFTNVPFTLEDTDHTAALWVPVDYDPAKEWPLIVYLHGAGSLGDSTGGAGREWVNMQNTGGTPFADLLRGYPQGFPAFVLMPRCPGTLLWTTISGDPGVLFHLFQQRTNRTHGNPLDIVPPGAESHIDAALDAVFGGYAIDRDRVTITGMSYGGLGALSYGQLRADRVAAIIAMSPQPHSLANHDLDVLATIPLWAANGDLERVGDRSFWMANLVRGLGPLPDDFEI